MQAKAKTLEPDIIYQVIEIDRELSAADWTKEDEESILTLKGHPGYEALLKKFKLQRTLIRTALETQKFETLEDFREMQAWSKAMKWAISQVRSAVTQKEPEFRSSYATEEEAFKEISRAIKVVGN